MEYMNESMNGSSETIAYHDRLIVAPFFCLITVLGLIGNTMVIVAVIVSKNLQTITNILVVNLAVSDFLLCLILPFMVVGLVDRGDDYPLPEIICTIITGVSFVSIAVSVMTLAGIALVRWYVISRSIRGHRGHHTPKKIGSLVAVIWVLAITLVALPLSFGIGEIGYSRYYSLCSVTDTNPHRFYFVVLQAGLILVALVVTGVFYILIVVHVTRQTRQLRARFAAENEGNARTFSLSLTSSETTFMEREIKITKNLFIVVVVFTICLLPSIVNFLIPGTSVLTLYGSMILAANSSINPIIYGLKHPNFQQAFKRMFSCHRRDQFDSMANSNSEARTVCRNI